MDGNAEPTGRRIPVTEDEISDILNVPVRKGVQPICDMYACGYRGDKPRCYLSEGDGRFDLCKGYFKEFAGGKNE